MKKILLTTLLLFVKFFGLGQVTLPHYEGFDYTPGQSLTSQAGWTLANTDGISGSNDMLVTSGSLSYSSYSNPTGGKVSFSANGEDAAKLFTQTTTGTIYVSFLLNVSSLNGLTTTGSYFFGLADGTQSLGSTIWLKKNGTGYNIGISTRTNYAYTSYVSTVLEVGTTHLICLRHEILADGDRSTLWLNPTTEGSALVQRTNTQADLSDLSQIVIIQGNYDAPSIDIDEIHIGTTWSNTVVMPVTLSYFNCKKNGKFNLIEWTTSSEQNNAGFNIQRSTNGANFENIGFVKSLSTDGNSSSYLDYSFTDKNPLGLNQYYRLKQTDFDGTSKYSAIVRIVREAPTQLKLTTVYPNPTRESLFINAASPYKINLQFLIFDLNGRVVREKQVFVYAGNNGFDISVAQLAPGSYILKAINTENEIVASEKFIKQ